MVYSLSLFIPLFTLNQRLTITGYVLALDSWMNAIVNIFCNTRTNKALNEHDLRSISDLDPDEVFPLIMPAEEVERRKGMKRLRTLVSQNYDEVDAQVIKVDIDHYDFPFENLVFEGGGNKGLAYCGAVRVRDVFMQYYFTCSYKKQQGVLWSVCCCFFLSCQLCYWLGMI